GKGGAHAAARQFFGQRQQNAQRGGVVVGAGAAGVGVVMGAQQRAGGVAAGVQQVVAGGGLFFAGFAFLHGPGQAQGGQQRFQRGAARRRVALGQRGQMFVKVSHGRSSFRNGRSAAGVQRHFDDDLADGGRRARLDGRDVYIPREEHR